MSSGRPHSQQTGWRPSTWLKVVVLLSCLALATTSSAEVNDRRAAVHKIYRGQTLGMLSKRYRVSIDAICHANEIARNHALQPGDKLVIPARADKDGSEARERRDELLGGGKAKQERESKPRSKSKEDASKPRSKKPRSKKSASTTKLHTVYRGQTLGMIARRYHVSVAALANANGIASSDPIHPGSELVIPAPDDTDGSRARREHGKAETTEAPTRAKRSKPRHKHKVHHVGKGHTLGKIAQRYHVEVDALCRANGITRTSPIRPGQELVIPAPDDDGTRANAWRIKQDRQVSKGDTPKGRSWRDYKKSAWKRGYVTLESANGQKHWKGYVLGPGNKLLPLARKKVSDVLASWRTGATARIHPRLVRLIALVSDTFGGRTIRVVSGFREHSYSKGSHHPEGEALDFSVNGVPNWAVRDYLRRIENVGVGYYPNSSFVHLDVRDKSTYWIDVSEPGERPRYVHLSYGSKRE